MDLSNYNLLDHELFYPYQSINIFYNIHPTPNIESVDVINKLPDDYKKMLWLKNNGYILKNSQFENKIFCLNLRLVESNLSDILSSIVYLHFITKISQLNILRDKISIVNPCNVENEIANRYYHLNIKRFLGDCAVGMSPHEVWNSSFPLEKKNITVRIRNGIKTYDYYHWESFKEYLFKNVGILGMKKNDKLIQSDRGTYTIKIKFGIIFL